MGTLVAEDGVGALFKGLVPALWLVSNPVVQYFTYERLRIAAALFRGAASSLGALDFFVIGALAKMAATVATYPIQVAQVLMYKTGDSTASCFASILRANGAPGLYKGMPAKLTQTCLNAALMFLFYEKLEVLISAVVAAG
jgi:adenine nucleotide transporter 17